MSVIQYKGTFAGTPLGAVGTYYDTVPDATTIGLPNKWLQQSGTPGFNTDGSSHLLIDPSGAPYSGQALPNSNGSTFAVGSITALFDAFNYTGVVTVNYPMGVGFTFRDQGSSPGYGIRLILNFLMNCDRDTGVLTISGRFDGANGSGSPGYAYGLSNLSATVAGCTYTNTISAQIKLDNAGNFIYIITDTTANVVLYTSASAAIDNATPGVLYPTAAGQWGFCATYGGDDVGGVIGAVITNDEISADPVVNRRLPTTLRTGSRGPY